MSVKRAVAEKYTIRNERGSWLATIFLDDQVGEICVQSEYGSYSYGWYKSSRGTETLKEFLVTTDKDYIQNKFGYDGKGCHFYSDKTVDRIKEEIFRYRRNGEINKEEARDCYQEVNDMDSDCQTSSELYSVLVEWAPNTMSLIYSNNPFDVPWVTGTHPQLIAFIDRVWPLFITQIKEELRENK